MGILGIAPEVPIYYEFIARHSPVPDVLPEFVLFCKNLCEFLLNIFAS